MDEYDSRQYLESVVQSMESGQYVHPFISKESSLPKRRVTKIMKLDPAHFNVATDTAEIMAVLVEVFIRDLVSRAYKFTVKDNRRSLQLHDICHAVQSDHIYDFLIDIVPRIQFTAPLSPQTTMANMSIFDDNNNNALPLMNLPLPLALHQDLTRNLENEHKEQAATESASVAKPAVRRSKRIKSKRSDKEELD